MQSGVEPLSIDVQSALAQAGATQQNFVQFQSVRAVSGSSDASFSFGTHASRPASGAQGDRYFETDRGWEFYYTGTAWAYKAGVYIGTDATRAAITPASTDVNALFLVTDTTPRKLYRVTSAPAWSLVGVLPNDIGAAVVSVATADAGVAYDATAQALINELKAQVNALLVVLRAKGEITP
jgi:hypothetical protein